MEYKQLFYVSLALSILSIAFASVITLNYNNTTSELDKTTESLGNTQNELQNQKNKPIVWSGTPTWGLLQESENTYQFEVLVYNGGESQSENVKLSCGVYDNDNKFIEAVEIDVGNIASKSSKNAVSTKKLNNVKQSYSAACIVKECNNCIKPRTKLSLVKDSFKELLT